MKKQKTIFESNNTTPFDFLSEEIVFSILDCLKNNSSDRKSFSLVCKSFYTIESRHRKNLTPSRPKYLTKIFKRYPHIHNLDLSLCARVTDTSLAIISSSCTHNLRSINLSRSRFFSHAGLSNLVMNCQNLIEIDLSNATELKDLAVSTIAEAKNLEKLSMVRCKSVTDTGIGCIAVGCKKLKFLNLKWCLSITDLGVGLIALKCKEIRSLDLSYMPISNKCLPQILELKFLQDLILEGCFALDDNTLASLKLNSTSLKSLDMSSCQNITHKGLSSLTNSVQSLHHLNLAYGSPVTQDFGNSLKNLTKLKSIKLDGCQVTSCGLKAINTQCGPLDELSISKCSGVTDEALGSFVKNQKELKKLNITCCRKITSVSIDYITSSCGFLTSLKMESCLLVSKEAFVLIGERCLFLEELDLTDSEVDDEGLKSISKCSKLTSLKLGICLNITDTGLIHIGTSCSNLKELDLYRCIGITDLGISVIAEGCKDLEIINTAYCRDITDRSFVSLSNCPKLNTLESRGCPLITSEGLSAIAMGCKQITKLDIKMCENIDDDGMIQISRFTQNLRQINLSFTSVTDKGFQSLANIRCLQNITILHVNGLTPMGLGTALLACEGLTKVKLYTSFKSLLPKKLLEHLEARGCVFQWRDKMFKAQLDSKSWKLQTRVV